MTLYDLERQHGPAAALVRHGRRYLMGSLNEEAADAWIMAIGLALQKHGALDAALLDICETYRKETTP